LINVRALCHILASTQVHIELGLGLLSRSISYHQGCGLGLEVSVSRQSRELTTSRLGQSAQRLGLGPIRLGPRLGLGPKRLGISSRSRAISCRWSRRFVRRVRSVVRYSRRRPIQTNLP